MGTPLLLLLRPHVQRHKCLDILIQAGETEPFRDWKLEQVQTLHQCFVTLLALGFQEFPDSFEFQVEVTTEYPSARPYASDHTLVPLYIKPLFSYEPSPVYLDIKMVSHPLDQVGICEHQIWLVQVVPLTQLSLYNLPYHCTVFGFPDHSIQVVDYYLQKGLVIVQ